MTGIELYEFMISETFKALKLKITKIQVVIAEKNSFKFIENTEEFAQWINENMKQLTNKEN